MSTATNVSDTQKTQASDWFMALRDEIVAAFEALEVSHSKGPLADQPLGTFEVSKTKRHTDDGQDAGGGLMNVMRGGRVFEKVGVNVLVYMWDTWGAGPKRQWPRARAFLV